MANLLRGRLCSELDSQTEIGPIRCEQSDTCLTQKKSLPQFLFLQIKGHYEVP